tara:strand:- start:41135 stop:41320 length:186 start_codon:yes stop_codon:yes gene_type:complete
VLVLELRKIKQIIDIIRVTPKTGVNRIEKQFAGRCRLTKNKNCREPALQNQGASKFHAVLA